MTPRTLCASQHESSSCMSARVSPAVVQHVVPRAGIRSDRNVHTDALCHKRQPQPAWRRSTSLNCLSQRRLTNPPWSQARNLIFAVLCALLFFCQSAQANVHGSSIFDRELVYDRRPAPKPRMGIYARQDDSSSSSATTTAGSSGILAPSSTSVSTSIQTASSLSTSLPRPFDSSIGNNFTESSCPQFFNDFLSNTTFQECLPFSMLLQVSMILAYTSGFTTCNHFNIDADIQLFLRRNAVSFIAHSHTGRDMPPSFLLFMQQPNVLSRHRTFHRSLQKRPLPRESSRNASLQRSGSIRHPLRRVVSHVLNNRKLLLRRSRL